jgi:phenylpyruvate tautomerase PptA (4-oxalocrotonate tautomerase family)
MAICLLAPAAAAQVSSEALTKSARIFTLAKFVHWPKANPGQAAVPLLFCVTAEPSLAVAFAAMAGRRIGGRLIRIEEIRPASASRCQLLYVGADPQARIAALQAIGNAFGITRSDDLVYIQITVFNTRTAEQKQALFRRIAALLRERPGIRPENVFVQVLEAAKENWSVGHGLAQFA